MSQIIVAQSIHGIILAAEKRAVQVNEKGEEVSLSMDRLIPLSPACALIAAGAVEGVEMGKSLKEFLRGEGLIDVQDLYGASLAYLATEHDRLMRKKCEILPIDIIHHVSFILAGKTELDQERPFRLYYLWTKKKLPQLDGDEISHAFCLPRRMGLEYQLNQMGKANASPEALVAKVKEGLDKFRAQGSVSGSFSWGKITGAGFEVLAL
jgi:hypothetical protein